jgi:hypothetical protein
MRRSSRPMAVSLGLMLIASVAALQAIPASATHDGEAEVTVGSDDEVFSQNKQNEPAVAIDSNHPFLVAAGANDNIDMEACNAGPDNDCPFTDNVGVSGVQFSFNSGDTWIQPEYTGITARDCLGVAGIDTDVCEPESGPIGTLPGYAEAGLVSDGDPGVAFGPVPAEDGTFSWDNGSRLYYTNLTSEQLASDIDVFRGPEAIAVSRLDFASTLTPADAQSIVEDQDNWLPPEIVSKQSATTFSDKVQVWADNAESSPFFGNAYSCWAAFRSNSFGNALATPLVVATSTDGGDTWRTKQVTDATNNPFNQRKGFGRSGCTVRTDSDGVVYVFANQFAVGTPGAGKHIMIRSFDGGQRWTRPVELFTAVDACFAVQFDGAGFRCVMDGVAGARDDLSSSPSVDIANGTPDGPGPDTIYDTWVDGRTGSAGPPVNNTTQLRLAYSTDGGDSFTETVVPIAAGDRPVYAAVAVSPDGEDLYLVYNAFTTPYQNNTTDPRGLVGVVLHSETGASGAPGAWTEVHRGASGDPRASAQNNVVIEFIGDYVYADAMNDFGVAVWNDVRQGDPCDDVDEWRQDVQDAGPPLTEELLEARPAIQQECAATFGNTDIWAWSGADPT